MSSQRVGTGFGVVVVGTDFSLDARRALRRASMLAYRPGAQVVVAHVITGLIPRKMVAEHTAAVTARVHAAALELSRQLTRRGRTDLETSARVLRGGAPAELGSLATELRADLIVLGRRGRRGLRDLLVGSTAQRIVRGSRATILVVGSPPRRPYRLGILGFDLSAHSVRAATLLARALPDGAHAVVVHAEPDPYAEVPAAFRRRKDRSRAVDSAEAIRATTATIAGMLPAIDQRGTDWQVEVHVGDPRRVILAVARREGADLIAMGSLGRTGLHRLAVGSVAEGVLVHATADVLITPARPLPPLTARGW